MHLDNIVLSAFVVTTSVVFPASAQTTKGVAISENVELVGITPLSCSQGSPTTKRLMVVAVDGDVAYIGVGVYLLILDITDKSAPALLGSVRLPGVVHGIAVSGGYAYVADRGSGLRVVDVRNPPFSKGGWGERPLSMSW